MVSVIGGAGKIPLPDHPLSKAGTPERLIAVIGAGLTFGIDAGDCACCVGGFGTDAGGFSRCWL
ncbi:MAG: hypothetical protein PHN79_05775 [Methanoregula sp.]|nr:hypothetical protein [Methanoregula sp.]